LQNEAGYAKPRLQLHESLRSFCIGCGSKVPNLDGQRRPPCKQHSNLSNSRRPRRDPRSLPGRWRWCDRPWLCDAQKASALHTLIRQRHPTPSCGGHAPTAERTMIPARMYLESLDRRPGIREQPRPKTDSCAAASRPLRSPGRLAAIWRWASFECRRLGFRGTTRCSWDNSPRLGAGEKLFLLPAKVVEVGP